MEVKKGTAFNLYTDRGHFIVDKDWNILRTDMPFTASGQWQFKGLVDRYGRAVPVLEGSCRFKNGKGRYHVIDLDHGTYRQWNDRVTGISIIKERKA